MKHLKVLAFSALALVVFSSAALAETQTVRVSGSLDIHHVYKNDFDLRSGNGIGVAPAAADAALQDTNSANTAATGDDGADWFMSAVQIEVAADLTDNVSVVVNLFNQRDWNADGFSVTTGNADVEEDFDVGVDLAYVQLKEAFYAPLTLVLGRQDIEFGRGFIFGNWQIQDPQASIIADELSVVTSFDAVRATLDFEPWTVDFVYANIAQGDANDEDDRGFWWTNINYQFSEYKAEWELYLGLDADRNSSDNAGAAASATLRSASPQKTWVLGTRAEFDPVENMTLGAEVAHQFGDFYATTNPTTSSEQSRDSWAFDIYGEYRWSENAYSPWIALEYVFLQGDEAGDGDFNGWNGMFRSPTYGAIAEYLEVYYETALTGDADATANRQHFVVSGGLSPMDDLSIDASYWFFWNDEAITNTTGGGSQVADEEIGTELDININYDYTEDVAFGLGLAWFFPGDLYGGDNGTEQGSLDDTATQIISSVSVAF
jgi:hypothetical protein